VTGDIRQSTLTHTAGDELLLALETGLGLTPTGLIDHPYFFSGVVARPDVTAAGVLAVADVATTTYLDLSALAATKDPVVTASGDRLRFESFSGCNGVHARFDLLADGIESGDILFGTTNVDINMPLRGALASVPANALLHLGVGAETLRVSTPDLSIEERKVELPERWIRGFAEIPTILAAMTPVADAAGHEAMAFLAGLPRGAPGPTVGVGVGPRGLRITAAGTAGSATLAGTARLSSLRRAMRHIKRLTAWTHDSGTSAWVADLEGGRITVVVSPRPYRGFSGEGQLLTELSTTSTSSPALRLLEQLAWEPVIDVDALASDTAMTVSQVRSGLAVLAASGKVGYDLVDEAHFHREIPYDADAVARDHPRLKVARELLAAGAVVRSDGMFKVGDRGHQHWVSLGDHDDATCTCRWHTRYGGGRGPCVHVLAVLLSESRR
jgi:hypothetical protein